MEHMAEKWYDGYDLGVNLDEVAFIDSLRHRHLYLTDTIDSGIARDIVYWIMKINQEDIGIPAEDRKPIKLFISTPGGTLCDGFRIVDMIENSVTPVHTIIDGYAYSMGIFVALAGKVRYGAKHSTYLIHDGSCVISDSSAKTRDTMNFYEAYEKKLMDFIVARSKITKEQYEENLRQEWYLFADEAKELGIIDQIIGEDIDFADVM